MIVTSNVFTFKNVLSLNFNFANIYAQPCFDKTLLLATTLIYVQFFCSTFLDKFLGLPTGVNFINILHTNFSYKRCFGSFFSSYMYFTCTWRKLPKWRSYEKFVRKMLMKLTARVIHAFQLYFIPFTIERSNFWWRSQSNDELFCKIHSMQKKVFCSCDVIGVKMINCCQKKPSPEREWEAIQIIRDTQGMGVGRHQSVKWSFFLLLNSDLNPSGSKELFLGQFNQCSTSSFFCAQIPKAQKILTTCLSFWAFRICTRKSCLLNVEEIDTLRGQFPVLFISKFKPYKY